MLLRVWPMPEMCRSIDLCLTGLADEDGDRDQENITIQQPVLIYGAGVYGRRILFDLRCREIAVVGFLDGNRNLWGKEIDGMCCYSLQDVAGGAVKGTIIVASIFREEIAQVLKDKGITSFWFKEDYERIAMKSAPGRGKILEVIAAYEE